MLRITVSCILAASLLPTAAQALPARIWVAVSGSDTAGCGPATAPCRSFQYAHDNIAPNGEIDVKEPGGYGTLAINKAISVVNDGVGAATIQAVVGNGITINSGPSDTVYLRGLSIDGGGTGSDGIHYNSGATLTVRDCTVRRFSQGIYMGPTSGDPRFAIIDTMVANNTSEGIFLESKGSTGTPRIVLQGVTVLASHWNIDLETASSTGQIKAQISNTTSSHGHVGIYLDNLGNAGASIKAEIDRAYLAYNLSGINVSNGSFAAISNSHAFNNGTGFQNSSGNAANLVRYGNNVAENNTTIDITAAGSTLKSGL